MSEDKVPAIPAFKLSDINPDLPNIMRELAKPDLQRIPESVFIEKWLPLFSNLADFERETIDDEATRRPVFLWVQEVSKNAQLPVQVCRGSEVLFEVPPLLADVSFDFRDRFPAYDLAGEVATAKRKALVMPALGEEHFRDRVEKVVLPSFIPSKKHGEAWNKIFERYGMPLMNLDTEAAQVQPAEQPQEETGGFNLDDIEEL